MQDNYSSERETGGEVTTSHERKARQSPRSSHKIEDLLAQGDYSQPLSAEDREWMDSPPVGKELI